MQEISLHILDVARNSLDAGASCIQLEVIEDAAADRLQFSVRDNGRGMDAETLTKVTDPFFSTRTTRHVGLGLPLLRANCEAWGGGLTIESHPGLGTAVTATMQLSHVDRAPLGKMGAVIQSVACGSDTLRVRYRHVVDGREFTLDTWELQRELGMGQLASPAVLYWLMTYVNDSLEAMRDSARREPELAGRS